MSVNAVAVLLGSFGIGCSSFWTLTRVAGTKGLWRWIGVSGVHDPIAAIVAVVVAVMWRIQTLTPGAPDGHGGVTTRSSVMWRWMVPVPH